MAITSVGSASNSAGSGTAISITHGLTIQADDVVLVVINSNDNVKTVADNNGANSFTKAYETTFASARIGVWWRRAGASEPTSYAFTLSASDRWSAVLLVRRGVHASGSPFDVAPSASTETKPTTGTTPTSQALTTATTDAWGVAFCATDPTSITAYPGDGYTMRQTTGTQPVSISDKAISGTAPVSQSAVSWTISTSSSAYTQHFALKPDAGGGSTAVSAADTGAATDTATLAATLTAADTGSAADEATVAGTLAPSDSASSADTATVAVTLTITDTATAADSAVVGSTENPSVGETAAATDAATVAVAVSLSDTASTAEGVTISVTLSAADVASAVDTPSVVDSSLSGVTPASRIYTIAAESRVYEVPAESRVYEVV